MQGYSQPWCFVMFYARLFCAEGGGPGDPMHCLANVQAATGHVALASDVAQAVYSLAVGSGDDAAYDTVQQIHEQVGLCKVIRSQPGVL
jgi:hypothetical protein